MVWMCRGIELKMVNVCRMWKTVKHIVKLMFELTQCALMVDFFYACEKHVYRLVSTVFFFRSLSGVPLIQNTYEFHLSTFFSISSGDSRVEWQTDSIFCIRSNPIADGCLLPHSFVAFTFFSHHFTFQSLGA